MEVVGFLESISQVVIKLSDSTSVSHRINITIAMVHVPDDNTIFVQARVWTSLFKYSYCSWLLKDKNPMRSL